MDHSKRCLCADASTMILCRPVPRSQVYLVEEDQANRRARKKAGGNSGKRYTEGWVEFEDKKVARGEIHQTSISRCPWQGFAVVGKDSTRKTRLVVGEYVASNAGMTAQLVFVESNYLRAWPPSVLSFFIFRLFPNATFEFRTMDITSVSAV